MCTIVSKATAQFCAVGSIAILVTNNAPAHFAQKPSARTQ